MDDLDFERLALSLQTDARDLKTFMEVLATKLEDVLPEATSVERSGGLFSKKHVRRIGIDLGENHYELTSEDERLTPSRWKAVRGIVLKREQLPLDLWIENLSRDLAEQARQSEQARLALERLLGI
jgi:hypothetical protein